MAERPLRNHTSAFKSKVALAAIRGEQILSDITQQNDVHPNQIKRWLDQLREGAVEVLIGPARRSIG